MPNSPNPDFEKNVFINCPFDSDFDNLLRPLLFTIIYLNFNPKIASERLDSGEQRLQKICDLIEVSKYSIHDLSRVKSTKKNEFSRHNMPFELGIDYGSRKFAGNHFGEKKFLVVAKERFDHAKSLSDLAGIDIETHNNSIEELIRAVRNWFLSVANLTDLRPASAIYYDFIDFMADFNEERKKEGYDDKDIYKMPIPEFTKFIKDWLEEKNA